MRGLVVVAVVAMLLRPLPAVGIAPAAPFRSSPPPLRSLARVLCGATGAPPEGPEARPATLGIPTTEE